MPARRAWSRDAAVAGWWGRRCRSLWNVRAHVSDIDIEGRRHVVRITGTVNCACAISTTGITRRIVQPRGRPGPAPMPCRMFFFEVSFKSERPDGPYRTTVGPKHTKKRKRKRTHIFGDALVNYIYVCYNIDSECIYAGVSRSKGGRGGCM